MRSKFLNCLDTGVVEVHFRAKVEEGRFVLRRYKLGVDNVLTALLALLYQ